VPDTDGNLELLPRSLLLILPQVPLEEQPDDEGGFRTVSTRFEGDLSHGSHQNIATILRTHASGRFRFCRAIFSRNARICRIFSISHAVVCCIFAVLLGDWKS
jgi:hypothetical protein